MNNIELVKEIYRKFANGDAPGILATFADDVEFRLAEGHPYQPSGAPWIGKDAIAQHFFMRAGPEWERWAVEISDVLAIDGAVVVEGRYSGTYKPTGRPLAAQVCHVWRFASGKVASFHQYVNTAHVQHVMTNDT